MKFILVEELEIAKFNSVIRDLSDDNLKIIEEMELYAIELVTSYLYAKYDVEQIFNKVGNERSYLIKRMVIDFIICQLFGRVNSVEMPQNVSDRCNEHKLWLLGVSTGKISANLPKLDPTRQANTYFKYGSEQKFNDTSYI